MFKNPQLNKLLQLANDICNGSPTIIASSNSEFAADTLHYSPSTKTFLFEYHRHDGPQPTSTGSILQREDAPAPFSFQIHEYNGKPPYLEITLGKFTSILHFKTEY